MQLASNPLLAENPQCLGEFLERIVAGAAKRSINPGAEAASPQATKRPLEDGKGDITPRDDVQPYKSFWAKFKRPSTPTPEKSGTEVGGAEVKVTTEEALATVPAPATTEAVREPNEASRAASAPDAVPADTPQKHAVVEVVEASPTPAKEVPDNQLGDSQLYPEGPRSTPPSPAPLEADTKDVKAHGVHQAGGDKPPVEGGSEKPKSLPPFSQDGFSEEFKAEMDKMFGPGDEDGTSKTFTPKPEDVRACLQRKTTVDLAPPTQTGHTRVLMSLAGVLQPVWVPMSADAARRSGLQLADKATDVPIGEPPLMSPATKTATATEEPTQSSTPAAEPTPKTTPAQEAPPNTSNQAGAGEDAGDKDADAAKNAVKNGYMRFFRSVNSSYAALRVGKNRGQTLVIGGVYKYIYTLLYIL